MSNFHEALKAEIAELESQLRELPTFRKLESLRFVLDLYEKSGGASGQRAPTQSWPGSIASWTTEPSGGAPRSVTRVPSESRTKALELAELFLRNRSGPTPTREILDHILTHGGEIGGQEPISNLSAMLSNSTKFQSNGRSGWTLADPEFEVASPEVLQDIVNHVLADLTSEEISSTFSWWSTHHKIPQELDARLLAESRRRLGRLLVKEESSRMRDSFAEALEKSIFS